MTTRSGDEMTQSADEGLPFGGRYTAAVEAAVQKLAVRARTKGLDADQINALIDTLPFASMLEETAKEIHTELLGGVPSLIASLDDGEREIADALTEVWGPPIVSTGRSSTPPTSWGR